MKEEIRLPNCSSLSVGFSRQEYCSGLPFPPPGDLPDLGMESVSPVSPTLIGRFFATEPSGKPPMVPEGKTIVTLYNTIELPTVQDMS